MTLRVEKPGAKDFRVHSQLSLPRASRPPELGGVCTPHLLSRTGKTCKGWETHSQGAREKLSTKLLTTSLCQPSPLPLPGWVLTDSGEVSLASGQSAQPLFNAEFSPGKGNGGEQAGGASQRPQISSSSEAPMSLY